MTDDLVTITIPRSAIQVVAAPPAFVHQKTVEAVVGISRRRYAAWAREGRFESRRDGKLVLARTEDVVRAVEACGIVRRDVKPENTLPAAPATVVPLTPRDRLAAVARKAR